MDHKTEWPLSLPICRLSMSGWDTTIYNSSSEPGYAESQTYSNLDECSVSVSHIINAGVGRSACTPWCVGPVHIVFLQSGRYNTQHFLVNFPSQLGNVYHLHHIMWPLGEQEEKEKIKSRFQAKPPENDLLGDLHTKLIWNSIQSHITKFWNYDLKGWLQYNIKCFSSFEI